MTALTGGVRERAQQDFKAGHLFWMPAGSTWLNRKKPRPFALATPCSRGGLGTLVYGSSQETEERSGAQFVQVAPVAQGLHGNRLRVDTYFYPGTLLPVEHRDLPPHAGYLGKSLKELRAALRTALGIGQGSCLRPGAPARSRRGRIVVLNPVLARVNRTRFAVILTEARYSREANYQIILPLFRSEGREGGANDLILPAGPWAGVFRTPTRQVLLPVPTIHSVWHASGISHETGYVVDEDTLAEIDRRLCDYFSLPPAEEMR